MRLQTVAEETADGFVVNGRKRWITNSVAAGWVSVLVRAGAHGDRATMLLVDLTSPGVRIGTPDLKMGHRGQITADIEFTDVQVPRENLLGAHGGGMSVALSAWCAGASASAPPESVSHRRRWIWQWSGCERARCSAPPAGSDATLAVRHGATRHRDRVCTHALSEGGHSGGSR